MLMLGLTVLMGLNVFFFSKTITLSDKIVQLEADSIRIDRENVSLEKEFYRSRSLTNLEAIAKKLDFTKPVETIYLDHKPLAKMDSRP